MRRAGDRIIPRTAINQRNIRKRHARNVQGVRRCRTGQRNPGKARAVHNLDIADQIPANYRASGGCPQRISAAAAINRIKRQSPEQDRIITPASVDRIVSCIAEDRVTLRRAGDRIIPRTAINQRNIRKRHARNVQGVRRCRTGQRNPGKARAVHNLDIADQIPANYRASGGCPQRISAAAAINRIKRQSPEQDRIITPASVDRIVTEVAEDRIALRRSGNRIVAATTINHRDIRKRHARNVQSVRQC